MGMKGNQFRSWLAALTNMGYEHRIISLNSMHAQMLGMPAPQSRDRVYIALWRKGERAPDFENMQRPYAFCAHCDEVVRAIQSWKKADAVTGKYRSQYVYRCPKTNCRAILEPAWLPAASIIDWSNPGTRIGDRDKPLAEKTMIRIRAGIERYWTPILTETANPYDASDPKHRRHGDPNAYYRSWPLTDPTQVMHTRESKALAYLPFMVPVEGRDGRAPWTAEDVMRAQTTRNETGMALPPFVLERRHEYRTRGIDEALSAVTANETTKALLFPPLVAELRGGGSTARPVDEALATVTAGGNHHALIMTNNHQNRARDVDEAMPTVTTATTLALIMAYYSRDDATQPASEPLSTATTEPRHALLHRMNGGGAEMSTPVHEPARTITTAGHQALLQGQSIDIDDVFFRMLEPAEIKRAMAFPDQYRMLGNRREQVKLAGNAVTPPAARDLVATVVAAITGEECAA
jgi:DNA (cytosine-5)-methyltransferase 1